MTHPTHNFITPIARDVFGMGLEFLLEAHPCGHLHNFTARPTVLPSAHHRAVQEELARLGEIHRHAYRGKPAEL